MASATKTYRVVQTSKRVQDEEKRAKTAFRQQLGQQAERISAIDEKIAELFETFDLNQNGFVSLDELQQGLLRWGIKLNKRNTDLLTKSFDGADNANPEQFHKIMTFFIKIRQNFTKFDADSSNTIDSKELVGFLTGFNYGFDPAFITKFLKFFDTDKSGELDWQETVELMLYINYIQKLFLQEDQEKDGVLAPSELQALLRALDMHVTVVETEVFLNRNAHQISEMNFEKFVELLLDMKENLDSIRKEATLQRKNSRIPRNVENIERKLPLSEKYQDNYKKHVAKVNSILSKCRASNKQFEDPEFPPDDAHLFPRRREALKVVKQWKRIAEFGADAALFKDGIDQGDVKQGALGDCWFLSSLCVLAGQGTDTLKNLFFECYPKEGIIQCRFYKDGEWVFIVTDDRIPCNVNGRPAFGSCRDKNELWVPVLEKCYAKLHGSFEALESGSISDGLVDITGESSETFDIKKEDAMFKLLEENLREGYLMGCAVFAPGGTVEMETELGILMLHAYGILHVVEIEGFKLVKIRNPWGNHEWKGRWSDGSKEWTPSIKAALNATFEDDGTFFMEFSDFCKQFNKLYVLRMLTDEIGTCWRRFDFTGEWKGETAAGCPNFPTWHKNPQYHVRSEEATKVFVSLRQPCMRLKTGDKPKYAKAIGFIVFVKGDSTDEPKTKRSAGDLVCMTSFFSGREISLEFEAKANVDYVIIPSHFNPGEENPYHIVIYTLNHKAYVVPCKKSNNQANSDGFPQAQLQQTSPSNNLPESTLTLNSAWIKGKSAGGCTNSPSWKESPQFILELPSNDKLTISLKQLQKVDGKYVHAGFVIMKSEPAKKRKFQTTDVVHQGQFINTPANEEEVDLPAGCYNILACTFHPNIENNFELSVKGSHLQKAKFIELTPNLDWKKKSVSGQWSPGKDGGCSNNKTTWMQNPMYCLDVEEKSTLKVLMEVAEGIKTAVGFYIFTTTDGKKVGKMICNSSFVQGAKNIVVVKDVDMEPGKYLVMTATFDPKHNGNFELNIYSDRNCNLSVVS